MKIFLLSITLAYTFFSANAQSPDYFENEPTWYLEALHYGTGDGSDSYSESAVISLHLDADYPDYYTARKRYERYYIDLGTTEVASHDLRYVRQEGRSIYFFNPETETDELFISYDLEVGDTVKGEFANINGIVIVQSIDSILVNSAYRHIFYTTLEPNEFENKHLIEGIGYLLNTTEAIGDFFGGDHYAGESIGSDFLLNCYGERLASVWSSTAEADCNLSLNIQEESIINSEFTTYPNPFQAGLNITSEIKVKNVSIYDLSGKTVFTNTTDSYDTSIDLKNLQSGPYILSIELEDGSIKQKKIMKQ